ncbi:MFS transporter [Pseudonocardia sp. S2-4]|uniref:MFS transporter n=1 Tax=Pseudonocardia humida TaxID=2800819 RepID=A0ABT1A3N8_9PSEU|nr:MFS transporter [Pseudonocardia humida]
MLSAGHACVDVYQGSVAALVPYFVAERAYGYAAVSGVVLAASLLSSVAQPLFGALADRRSVRWLLPASTLVSGVGVALSGLWQSYALTLAAVAVSGIGVAAYHPESARVARAASGGGHSAMGWFALGGNLGFAAAPLLVAAVMAGAGLGGTPWLALPALLGACASAVALRTIAHDAPPIARPRTGRDDWPSFRRLTAAVICRSIVFVGLSTFVALHVRQRTGGGDLAGTAALAVLYLGGAIGTVAGGRLADRYGRIAVVRWSALLTVLAVTGVVVVPGPTVYAFVALASAGLYVPFSLHVTLGQDYLPSRVGTAGGVTLGLTAGIGGLATPLIGALADATTLQVALAPLAVLPVVGVLFLRGLREPEPIRPVPAQRL